MSEEDIPPLSPFYSLFIQQLEQLENAEAEDETEGARNDRIFQYLAQVSAQDDLKVNDYFKGSGLLAYFSLKKFKNH